MSILKINKRFTLMHFASWMIACILGIELGSYRLPSFVMDIVLYIANIFSLLLFIATGMIVVSGAIITPARMRYNKFWGKLFRQTLLLSLFLTIIAALAGLFFCIMLHPRISEQIMSLPAAEYFVQQLIWPVFMLGSPPERICAFCMELLVIALLAGFILGKYRRKKRVLTWLRKIQRLQKFASILTKCLIYMLPFGVFVYSVLIAHELNFYANDMMAFGRYTVAILLANIFLCFIVLPCLLYCYKVQPFSVFKNMLPAVLTAFFTRNSLQNMPLTLYFAENKLNAKKRVTRFVIPLCSFINMNGSAIFTVVTLLVALQYAGVSLNVFSVVGVVLVSVMSAILSFGSPHRYFFLLFSLLLYLDMPLAFVGAIWPFYLVVMYLNASVQVWSDSCICAIVEKNFTLSESQTK